MTRPNRRLATGPGHNRRQDGWQAKRPFCGDKLRRWCLPLACLGEEGRSAVRRKIGERGEIEPGEIAFTASRGGHTDDSFAWSVAPKQNAAVTADIVKREHTGHASH